MMIEANFFIVEALKIAVYFSCALLGGVLVIKLGVKVNYTRKILHFALFFLPFFLAQVFTSKSSILTSSLSFFIGLTSLGLFSRPFRSRVPLVRTAFAAFDRPEDRPHTLPFLVSQILAGGLVLIPLNIIFTRAVHPELVYIPILVNAIGDGLAEPVGVRFGRHTYTTKALYGGGRHVRSLEGSACVFAATILILLVFHESFSAAGFITGLVLLPVVMTLAEAFAPCDVV